MSNDNDRTIQAHTYTCALPTRGGVCNCQPGHNPSINPWLQLSGEQYEDHAGNSRPPASLFRPGGRHRMFKRALPSEPLVEERREASSIEPAHSRSMVVLVQSGLRPTVDRQIDRAQLVRSGRLRSGRILGRDR